jgi:hypothetical protein
MRGSELIGSVAEGRQELAGLGRVRCREAGVGRQREVEVTAGGGVIPERGGDRARVEAEQWVA